jgi:hypothetical protein
MATRTFTTAAEFAIELAAATDGDVLEADGVVTGRPEINRSFSGSGITIQSADASSSVAGLDYTGTIDGVICDGLRVVGTGWPYTNQSLVNFGSGTFNNLIFNDCLFRHGYGASLVDFDMTADLAEYERIDNDLTATTTSTRYALTFKDGSATSAWIEFFNNGAEDVYFKLGDNTVVATSGDTLAASGAAQVRTDSFDPQSVTHIAILSASGSVSVNARTEIGLPQYLSSAFAASGSATVNEVTLQNSKLKALRSGAKGFGIPQNKIVIFNNEFEQIYEDIVSLSVGTSCEVHVLRNLTQVPFSRSGRAQDEDGDARDPHGDQFQMFANGAGSISDVLSAGFRTIRQPVRTGSTGQGALISDNDYTPSYVRFQSISDTWIGGSDVGLVVGEKTDSNDYPARDTHIFGATVLNAQNVDSTDSAIRLATDDSSASISKTVYQRLIVDDGEVGFNDSLLVSDAADADLLFPDIDDLATATTVSEVESALTSAAEAEGLGAVGTTNAIDWVTTDYTQVVKWENVDSGVAWQDQSQVDLDTVVTFPLRTVTNRRDSQTVVPGTGVEWRSTESDGTTEVQAWTTSSGTIDHLEKIQIRKTSSSSGGTSVSATITINGFEVSPTITTVQTLADPFALNGATFEDTANVPASTSVIEYEVKTKLPSAPPNSSILFRQLSAGQLIFTSASEIYPSAIEDSTASIVYTGGETRFDYETDRVYTINMLVDFDNSKVQLTVDNVLVVDGDMSSSSGTAQTNRKLQFAPVTMPSDSEFEYFKVWLTTSSVRTLHKEISVDALGSIANINSDPWITGSVVDATPNNAPTDITLSSSTITEGNSIGDAIGTLSATDADEGDTHTFTLVSGTGDTDNASFTIDGTSLKAAEVFDYETQSSYSIRVNVNDGTDDFAKALSVTVTDVDEVPPDAVQDAFALLEGGTLNLNLATNDSDGGSGLDLTSITITTAPQNGSIVVNDNGTVDYTHDDSETTSDSFEYTIADNEGNVSDPAEVTLTIIPVDEVAPTIESAAINTAGDTLTVTFDEDVTGTSIPTLSIDSIVATYTGGSGSDGLVYSLDRVVYSSELVTLAYASADIEDAAGNALADVSGVAVTNNSTLLVSDVLDVIKAQRQFIRQIAVMAGLEVVG